MVITHNPLPGSRNERGFSLDSIELLCSELPDGIYIRKKNQRLSLDATLQPDSSAVNALHPLVETRGFSA